MISSTRHLVKIAAACAVMAPAALHAATFDFHVDLDVSALIGASTSPFALDFQLNKGSGLDNTVSLSHFTFDGGSFSGSASGNATGSLGSSVFLAENSTDHAFVDFSQGFTASTTTIHFDVSVSQNGTGITPDGFVVDILDNTSLPIFTSADDTIGLLELSVTGNNNSSDIATYVSTDPAGVTVTATAVPEPTAAMYCMAAAGLALFRRHRAPRSVAA